MAYYLDTSAAFRVILGDDPRAADWLASVVPDEAVVSSTLLRLELTCALRRDRSPLELQDPLIDKLVLVSVSDALLELAGTIIPHLRSLDAIHVATVLSVDPTMTLVTHDEHMRAAAAQLGIATLDPVA